MNNFNISNEELPRNKQEKKSETITWATKKSLKKIMASIAIIWAITWTAVASEKPVDTEETTINYQELKTIHAHSSQEIWKIFKSLKEWEKIILISPLSDETISELIEKLWFNFKIEFNQINNKDKWNFLMWRLTKEEEEMGRQMFEEAKKHMNKKIQEIDRKRKEARQKLEESEKRREEARQRREKARQELALSNYGLEFSQILLDTLKWIDKKSISPESIITNLKKLKEIIHIWNIMPSEKSKKNVLNWLETIKLVYPKDKEINNLVDNIIKQLKSYDVNLKLKS